MRTIDAYSNSEITNAINSVISNKYDRHIIYSRLVRGETWQDLSVFASKSKRHYERLCSKVIIKLFDECWEGEKMTNKEAIKYLKEVQSHIDLENGGYTQEMYDAIDIAIVKLQANYEQVKDTTEEAVKKCAKAFDGIQAKIYEIEKSAHMLVATLDKLKEMLYPHEQ